MTTIYTAYTDYGDAEFACDIDGFEYAWVGESSPGSPPMVRKWTSRPAMYFAPGSDSGVLMSLDDAMRNLVGA